MMADRVRRVITSDRLRELLLYEPLTGEFYWIAKSVKTARTVIGTMAGAVKRSHDGDYRVIRVDGRLYRAARLAWLYMTDEWPDEVDHIDRRSLNDRWANLRSVTSSQNKINQRLRSDSTSGHKGVHFFKRRSQWRARIQLNGRERHLGYFTTFEEACEAYEAAAVSLHGDHRANIVSLERRRG